MTKPRIVHVIHSSAFGGGPNMLAILCLQLSNGEASVYQLPPTTKTKWSFTCRIPLLTSLIRSRKPDLVHLHGRFAGSLGQLAGWPRSLYTVQWPSYLDDGGPWSRLRNYSAERVSCGLATAVAAVSEHDQRQLVARGLCDVTKLDMIHNAYCL